MNGHGRGGSLGGEQTDAPGTTASDADGDPDTAGHGDLGRAVAGSPRQVDPVADRLAAAMVRRVATVDGGGMPAARDAVDVRLRRRARARRRQRYGVAALAVVVAVVAVGMWPDTTRRPDVYSDSVGDPDLVPFGGPPAQAGIASSNPADVGLPRVVVDPGSGLRPAGDDGPLAETRRASDRVEERPTEMLVVRHTDTTSPEPVMYVTPSEGGELPSPADAGAVHTVSVAGRDASLRGTPPRWVTLTWPTAEGHQLTAWAYGLDIDALTRLAAALDLLSDGGVDDVEVVGDALPEGFAATVVTLPEEAVIAEYTTVLRDPAGSTVVLDVLHEPALLREQRLAVMLADTVEIEPARFLGRNGLAARHADGSWTAVVAPDPDQPDLAVAVRTGSTSRAELDATLAVVRVVDAVTWDTHHPA